MLAPSPLNVAIVGGGAAGLLAAYHLHEAGVRTTVFERRAQVGGNAETHQVEVNGRPRVVDLGVSDFNAASYTRIAALAARLGVATGAMDASLGFSGVGASFVLGRPGPAPRPELDTLRARFCREAPKVLADPALRALTVDEWLSRNHFDRKFAETILHPRISALWFGHEGPPGDMPVAALQHFARLQEGARPGCDPRPDRRWFRDGARALMLALAAALPDVRTNQQIQVSLEGPRPEILPRNGPPLGFDAVIFAVHAEDVATLVRGGLPAPVAQVLGRFRYTSATAHVHRHTSVLPMDRRAWGAFNARVRPVQALREGRPYTVTMSVDRHQGCTGDPGDLLVTVKTDRTLDPTLLVRGPDVALVTASFRHNVADASAAVGQAALPAVQGWHGAWFCGGYAHGVGLLEDCAASAEAAAVGVLARFGRAARSRPMPLAALASP
jgi:predicted NAD/FAD-binding protein